jgi:hypothetical protein
MKHLLLTTIAAVVLVGCGPSVDIWEATAKGNIEAVKQHLAAGTDVNALDHGGNTPLHHAVYNDQTEIIRLLIDKGAEVKGKRKAANHEEGVAPLHTATWRSTIETMELLIDNGADVNMKRADGAIALHLLHSQSVVLQFRYWDFSKLLHAMESHLHYYHP